MKTQLDFLREDKNVLNGSKSKMLTIGKQIQETEHPGMLVTEAKVFDHSRLKILTSKKCFKDYQ